VLQPKWPNLLNILRVLVDGHMILVMILHWKVLRWLLLILKLAKLNVTMILSV
jgi:hypothetical protein